MCKEAAVEGRVLAAEFDETAFLSDVQKARAAIGEAGLEDARHFQNLVNFTGFLIFGGYAALAFGVCRPLGSIGLLCCIAAAFMISLSRCIRWTIIGHHVSHGGFDAVHRNVPGALPAKYKRGVFGVGMRRFLDWLDWMHPAAWNVEHNKAHHYYLSEVHDPDNVQQNFAMLRDMPIPVSLKYASMVVWLLAWKILYYSPNTFKELCLAQKGCFVQRHWPAHVPRTSPLTVAELFATGPINALLKGNLFEVVAFWPLFTAQWIALIVPMVLSLMLPVLVPLALGASGVWPFGVSPADAAWRCLAVVLAADALTNAHSFVIIACNHSGEDLYWYTTSCKAYTAEWFLRCAYSSANFETGSEFVDVMYGWLNYQIEHHMFPDLTPLQYRKLQPLIKSICKKHGVQYVQQNVFIRTWKMLRIAVGAASMKCCVSLLEPSNTQSAADTLVGG